MAYKLSLLLFLSLLDLEAQTTKASVTKQLQMPCVAPAAALLIPLGTPTGPPSVALICVQLDPAAFKLDSTTTPPTLRVTGGTAVLPTYARETPAGTINGTNATFTLSSVPLGTWPVEIFSAILLTAGVDYTISGFTITFLPGAIPQPGDVLQASYWH